MTGGSWRLTGGLIAKGQNAFAGSVKTPKVTVPASALQSLAYGTGSGQFDILVVDTVTLAAATPATYDLYTGTDLKDVFGFTAAFRKVKGLFVWIDSGGDAAGVRIGGAAANTWQAFFADPTDKHLIFPSGPAYQGGSPDGVAVGATTKNLLVENLGAVAAVVGIAIAGTSI